MKKEEYTKRYRDRNPYTNKKPCIKCGSTERYSSPPYQCKPCQRKRANERNNTIAILESNRGGNDQRNSTKKNR